MEDKMSDAIAARLAILSQQIDRLAVSVDNLNTLTAKLWVVTCGDGQGLVDRVNSLESAISGTTQASILYRLAVLEQTVRRWEKISTALNLTILTSVLAALLALVLK